LLVLGTLEIGGTHLMHIVSRSVTKTRIWFPARTAERRMKSTVYLDVVQA